MLTQDVAIAHLNSAQQEQVLMQDVLVLAEIEGRFYSLTKSCAEIFPDAQPAPREEIDANRDAEYNPLSYGLRIK